mgnify:CR=1 FL=1
MVGKCQLLTRFLLSALLLLSTASAAESSYLQADEIHRLLKNISKPTLTTGQFEQSKYIKDLSVTLKTSGTYKIYKYNADDFKVIWNIQSPEKMNVCIDTERFVFENLATKKKNILKLDELSQNDSSGLSKLIHLIKLNPKEITTHFNIQKQTGDLLIIPKQENQFSFLNAVVSLDKLKNLKQMKLKEKSGDQLEMRFLKTVENKNLSKLETASKSCD